MIIKPSDYLLPIEDVHTISPIKKKLKPKHLRYKDQELISKFCKF